ncbi:GerAB/ArcD/ProY family transporter [Paenibacillus tengchongensis]|uniref:GerAB/ArcD/ProY family transporter n=1 Tax=Paenibacillus tengchongensis TaxID=2608684 RepID=UPI00124CED8D|nr:GerAB/ArcD/ProY family transporter [Paenibacillus tengchongensis]
MTKNRYYFWLILMNSLINIVNFVPRELIDGRFTGAQASIPLAVAAGTLLTLLFTAVIRKFPGMGVPEIFTATLPKFTVPPLLMVFGLLWCIAGLITLLSFVDITLRFISPDTGPLLVLISFLAVVCFSVRIDSHSLLYTLEMMLGISLPLIVYATIKAVMTPSFCWDSVLQTFTYSLHAPNWHSFLASTFSFSGYINLAIFNRVFQQLKLKPFHFVLVALQGLVVLLLSLFVPIGFFGTAAVEKHIYTWFSTADSIRIETFIIERMLFIFYMAYLTLSLVSIIIHWHVGKELLLSLFPAPKRKAAKARKWQEASILAGFCAAAVILMRLDQYELNTFGVIFLDVRWYGEIALLLLLLYCYAVTRRRSL